MQIAYQHAAQQKAILSDTNKRGDGSENSRGKTSEGDE